VCRIWRTGPGAPTGIDWLVQQAFPAYVPEALRRTRSFKHLDEDLQAAKETTARQALAQLEKRYEQDREVLEQQLRGATEEVAPVRQGLLYGTGGELANSMRSVLAEAGFEVHDLDAKLGGTKSADLLAVWDGKRCLIEVKSASKNASESLVSDLQKHISTWPNLQPAQEPLTHAALIVSHQCRQPPRERSSDVYTRTEFVSAIPFPVISAVQLLDWWRASDWPAIRNALLTSAPQNAPDDAPAPGQQSDTISGGKPARGRLLPWRRKSEKLRSLGPLPYCVVPRIRRRADISAVR
jgi:hypothetical protein